MFRSNLVELMDDLFGVDNLFKTNYINRTGTLIDPSKIELELPGVKKDAIAIEHSTQNGYTRLDVSYEGRYKGKREFIFSEKDWDADKTEASFEDGLLTITVPPRQKSPPEKKVKRLLLK